MGKDLERAHEPPHVSEVGRKAAVPPDLNEPEPPIKGDQTRPAHQPQRRPGLPHELLHDGSRDSFATPVLANDKGGELPGSVSVSLDLSVPERVSSHSLRDDESAPVQSHGIDSSLSNHLPDPRLITSGGRAQSEFRGINHERKRNVVPVATSSRGTTDGLILIGQSRLSARKHLARFTSAVAPVGE